jgi:hypothetical protein
VGWTFFRIFDKKAMKRYILILPILMLCLSVMASPADTTREVSGVITSRTGNVVVITVDREYTPESGVNATLYKYFEEEIFGMKTTGWLDVALVKVTAVKGKVITLEILKENSEIIKNGKKVNHFVPGKTIKLQWW